MDETEAGQSITKKKMVKLLLGFAVAMVLVYLLGAVIGWGKTLRRLRTATPGWIVAACLSTFFCLGLWGKMWQEILSAVGVSVSYRRVMVTFFAANFANYVTPMGQAGGEPFIAYVLSRDTEANYEQSLASVVVTDLLRLLPFFTAAGIGLGYLIFRRQLPDTLENLAILLVVLAVALPTLVVVGWWYRERVKRGLIRLLSPVARRTELFTVGAVRERIERLYGYVELIADSRRAVLTSVGLAYAGWILFALPLYFSGLALNLPLSLLLVSFIVPMTIVIGFTPLPGGLGAIEGGLVVLLTTLAAFSATDALAVTTVYRLTSYWIVVAVGGLAAFWVTARA